MLEYKFIYMYILIIENKTAKRHLKISSDPLVTVCSCGYCSTLLVYPLHFLSTMRLSALKA